MNLVCDEKLKLKATMGFVVAHSNVNYWSNHTKVMKCGTSFGGNITVRYGAVTIVSLILRNETNSEAKTLQAVVGIKTPTIVKTLN